MKRVVFVAVPPLQILDLTGPFEVFARCGGYSVELFSARRGSSITSSCGLKVAGARHYGGLRGHIDTLIVPGGGGAEELRCDREFLKWLKRTSQRSRRTASICTGTFILAAAGLLNHRRATTHWAWCDRLARQFTEVDVAPEPIFVRDGPIYTSAGITAGIDLSLALIEEDHGRQRAKSIARDLVMYLRRSAGQSQFSMFLTNPEVGRGAIEMLLAWLPGHLRSDLSVEALASRCSMSPRHFARVFTQQTGLTPARFVERLRVGAVRELLEDTRMPLKKIADRCGFASADSMRRAFLRAFAVTPARYGLRPDNSTDARRDSSFGM
jgi:transcriptional regulator GlxA family with amidase domain